MQRLVTKSLVCLFIVSLLLNMSVSAQDRNNTATSSESIADAGVYLMGLRLEPEPNQKEKGSIWSSNKIRIINLGPIVNWKGNDYAPTVSADGKTLYFVSNRPGGKLNEKGKMSEDFWAIKKTDRMDSVFQAPFNIDPNSEGMLGVNTPLNEGAASLAADRQTLYFTACDRPDGLGGCDIYKTIIEGDKWGRPINLGRNVNSDAFDTQPSISPDQSRLYFASVRKGPHSNGKPDLDNADIWYCDWDQDLEEWKPAKNLEAINTDGTEVSPFIGADGITLFFASNGHKPNYGGLDFYTSTYDAGSNSWSKPMNLGEPLNTDQDEQFISLPASGDIIYFSSRRDDIPGVQGALDLYMAYVPTFFRAVNVIGTVTDECSGEFIPANIVIKNPITGRTITDSLSLTKTNFEFVVGNADYGNPKDSINFVDFQITASNAKYGTRSTVQRVNKPSITDDPDEAKKYADVLNVNVTLGQRPVIKANIDEAAYVARTKATKPELASFRGLIMEEVQTWDLYPLLNYVFFDEGSSDIPKRYIMFKNNGETSQFADTTIAGGTLNKYYHLMNIYGFRLNRYKDAKIEIVGCNDGTTPAEKRAGLSKERAEKVYNYFKDVWNISPDRMKLTFRDKPAVVSNLKDSLGIIENRRVEILCDEWNVTMPVFNKELTKFPQPEQMKFELTNGIEDGIIAKRRIEVKHGKDTWNTFENVGTTDKTYEWDWTNVDGKYPVDNTPFIAQLIVTTQKGAECKSDPITIPVRQVSTTEKKVDFGSDSTLERYSLILFPFAKFEAGPVNQRIMRDYVYGRVKPTSTVEVVGHTDVVGLYETNQKLSDKRANTVKDGINKETGSKYGSLTTRGVGEEEPLYKNDLPEARFYNRTVQVIIRTPVADAEK